MRKLIQALMIMMLCVSSVTFADDALLNSLIPQPSTQQNQVLTAEQAFQDYIIVVY